MIFPAHVRIKDDDILVRWSNLTGFERFWYAGLDAIILLAVCVVIKNVIMGIPVSWPGLFFLAGFFCFANASLLIGNKAYKEDGEIVFGDDICYKNTNGPEFYRYDYDEVYAVYFGACPTRAQSKMYLRGWNEGHRINDARWNEYYGDNYLIARRINGELLFAVSYREEIHDILRERCSGIQEFEDAFECRNHIVSLPAGEKGYRNELSAELDSLNYEPDW